MAVLRRTKALISTQRPETSVVNASGVIGQVTELFPLWRDSTEHAKAMDNWYYNEINRRDMPKLPRKTTSDIKDLRDASTTGWAKMIADSMSQDFIFDGIRQRNNGDAAPATRLIQQNRLFSKQRAAHDGVIRHGKAFNLIGPAVGRLDGKDTAFIRPKSALTCDAFYRDDFDEYAEFFLEGVIQHDADGTRRYRWDFYDDVNHHRLTSELDGSKMTYIDYEPHGMNICPVVRAAPNLDLTGRAIGEIEPYVILFKRLNQSTLDRLVVQRFGAFVIRWIAGIEEPDTDEKKRAAAIALSLTDLLMVENPQSKVGSLPATPLDGYIRSREADIRDLSAVSQTPSFHMLGLSDNVGADGLAAAEASHTRKGILWKVGLSDFWETSLRLAGFAAGPEYQDVADDFESRLHWKDTSSYSFQSWAQGLGTLATQLEIPGEALWQRIPGWEESDTQHARKLREEAEAKAELDAELAHQQQVDLVKTTAEVKAASGGSAAAR